VKSIRTDPTVHAAEGDERIRTAVCAPSADPVYEAVLYNGLEYGTGRPFQIGRCTYARGAHRYVALTYRYLEEPDEWRLTWVGEEGRESVRMPHGVVPPDAMVEALKAAPVEGLAA
jgi:hypothetical protein